MSTQPRITTPRDLLVDDLKRLLTVETTLANVMLPKLVQEAQNAELKSALQKHAGETKEHVAKVKQAFAQLGMQPEGKDAPGVDALKQEHESGIGEVSAALREAFDARAAIGTEHYEISIYSSALVLARAAGEHEVESLLGANLEQEFAALKKLEGIIEQLAQNAASS